MFLRSIMIVHQRGQRSLFKLTTAKPLGPGSGQLKAGFIGRKIADDRRSSKELGLVTAAVWYEYIQVVSSVARGMRSSIVVQTA